MADNSSGEFLTASIDDYLLAVADGVHQAQLQLSQMRIPAQPGQPAITYQLPRLDFELKMSFEVSRRSGDTGGRSGLALRARPVGVEQASGASSTAEAASIIKGSFVAVPTDGGKPPAVVRTLLKRISARALEIVVLVQSATGENLEGVDVQFNVDREQSRRFNQAEGLDTDLKAGTNLLDGRVPTQANGQAGTALQVAQDEPAGSQVVVLIDVVGKTETIIFKVE